MVIASLPVPSLSPSLHSSRCVEYWNSSRLAFFAQDTKLRYTVEEIYIFLAQRNLILALDAD